MCESVFRATSMIQDLTIDTLLTGRHWSLSQIRVWVKTSLAVKQKTSDYRCRIEYSSLYSTIANVCSFIRSDVKCDLRAFDQYAVSARKLAIGKS